MTQRQSYEAFLSANTAKDVVSTFETLVELTNSQDILGLPRYTILSTQLPQYLSFRQKQIFKVLNSEISKRKKTVENYLNTSLEGSQLNSNEHIIVSGAGPCGFKAAVECLLLGNKVTIIEKRMEFSRVNILTLWEQTMNSLVDLGAKYFYPRLKTKDVDKNSKLHMGTREIQLCLLKTFLLLGGRIKYGYELSNIRLPLENGKYSVVCIGMNEDIQKQMLDEQVDPLSFKVDHKENYDITFKCNMRFSPKVDESLFISHNIVDLDNEQVGFYDENFGLLELKRTSLGKRKIALSCIEFDALILAEGEWSSTSRKLGFDKVVDKFSQAIGLVINLEYNDKNKIEKKLREFNVSKINADWRSSPLKALNEFISCENMEYLRGSTHYIVITISLSSLVKNNIITSAHYSPVLDKSNVKTENLFKLARKISSAVGIPETCSFTKKNPVQLFDFSARARAVNPHIFLTMKENKVQVESIPSNNSIPVFPIGDTLFEPFWPQGLGSNRGFHGAMDAIFSLMVMQRKSLIEGDKERRFSYSCMNQTGWRNSYSINEYVLWDIDPINRYLPDVLRDTRERGNVEIPERFIGVDFKMRKEALLRK
eukprot:maker-scaffold_44-snap-gene-1.100-mRNA-1 protein AED:0.07 eAED:0.07 QI:0/0/0/1/1/1/2/0/596